MARQLTEAKEAEAEPPKAAVPQGGVSQRFQVPSGGVEFFGKIVFLNINFACSERSWFEKLKASKVDF